MKIRQVLELVQQHHPDVGEVELLKYINQAMDTFAEETKIVEESFTTTTVANQRYYDIDQELPGILEIDRVTLTDSDGRGFQIPRLLEIPEEEDKDLI